MLGTEFIDTVSKLRLVEYTGVEDFADKLSFIYSVLVLILCTSIISVKQYLLSAIACYTPTSPSGSDFDSFLVNYCWVHGTIPILNLEDIPQNDNDWKKFENERINYYQWVPFMLGLQCLLFYLPRILWQVVCYNRTGNDLEHLISLSSQASRATGDSRKALIRHVAVTIEETLYQHRDYKSGALASAKRTVGRIFGPLYASKRQGTWLVFGYFCVKVLYALNSFGQLALMQRFLGMNASYGNFGLKLTHYMLQGKDWQHTRIFPRVSYCHVTGIRHLGVRNDYTAQCVLPVNMLNEKVYIFLWFWTAIVATFTVISIPIWFYRISFGRTRIQFVKKFLRLTNTYQDGERDLVREFVYNFLRYDGLFLMRMISINSGDVICSEIVKKLWNIYKKRYANPDLDNEKLPFPDKMPLDEKPPLADNSDWPIEPSAPRKSFV